MYQVVIAEPIAQEGIDLLEAASDVTCIQLEKPEPAALLETAREAHALIIRGRTVVDLALFEAAPDLKVVARAGLGLENVDVWTATERGVMVMNVPGAYAVAAAEHTLGLILSLARHIPTANAALHQGEWQHQQLIGMELHGKTLGVVGLGGVGRKVSELARAFGMTVVANDPYVPDEVARQQQVIMADLDELLTRSDFVSVHVPATPDTEQLIDAEQIAKMKPGAYLINMAWSRAVDPDALCEALQGGKLSGAALDVFAGEPQIDDGLCALPNVVLTPHLGDHTHEAQREIAIRLAQQVIDALRGTDFRNVANLPFISGASYERLKGYLQAAECIGALQVEMADGPIRHLQVECFGESLWDQVRPITVALLKGILERTLDGEINYINAPVIAHKRGLEVSQARGLTHADYPALVACRAVGDGWERVMAGTVFAGTEPRITQIGRFRTELKPVGRVLAIRSVDLPGVIGQIGTLLGKHQVNIAAMDYGRVIFGGAALSLLTVDSQVSDEVVADLLAIEPVQDVRQIDFGE